MKIAVIIIRILIGALLLFASLAFFFDLVDQPPLSGTIKTYMDGLMAVQLMPIVKVIELLCGIAFISGRFVALANLIILPISFNIFLFHATLAPEGISSAAFLFLGNIFLLFAYRKHYTLVFAARRIE